MNADKYRGGHDRHLHKCVIDMVVACNEQITARFLHPLHTFYARFIDATRYACFTLQKIHYQTHSGHIAHDDARILTPISACKHTIYADHDLRDTYIPTVALGSAVRLAGLFSLESRYVRGA